MADSEFERNAATLREDDPDAFEGNWRRAAEAFGKALMRGDDISSVIDLLEDRFQDSHQVPAMEAIAKVLVSFHLQHNSLDRLLPLMRSVTYGDTVILQALRPHAGNKANFDSILPLVTEVLSFSTQTEVFQILERQIWRSATRMAEILRALSGNPASRDRVSELLKDAVIAGRHREMDLAPAMPILAELLDDPLLSQRASGSLTWIAEADIDISALAPSLKRLASSADKSTREQAAYALAYFHLTSKDWEGLDGMLSSEDFSLRKQAVHAMGVTLVAKKRSSRELISRVAEGLLDTAAGIRVSCREILSLAKAAGELAIEPEVLDRLMESLEDPEKGEAIAEFLFYFADKSAENARLLQTKLGAVNGKGRGAMLSLRCEELLSRGRPASCDICLFIPRRGNYGHPVDVEKYLSRLAPALPVEQPVDRMCPECGNYYWYRYSERWESPTEGMSIDYEIELQRLTPPEMRSRLSPEVLKERMPDYESALSRCKANLTHPEKYIREDAAHAVVMDAVERKDCGSVAGLLHHTDDVARRAALASWFTEWKRDPSITSPAPIESELTAFLNDPDNETRSRAAEALCSHYGTMGDTKKLRRLLDRDAPTVRASVMGFLRSHPELPRESFHANLKRLARHPDERVRSQARMLLLDEARQGTAAAEILSLFRSLLTSKEGTLKKEGAAAMEELAWNDSPEAPRILKGLAHALTVDEARYHAFSALEKASSRGHDISPAFPRLLEIANDRADTSGYRKTAMNILKSATQQAARQGLLKAVTVRDLSALLNDSNEEIRGAAADCFKQFIDCRVNLLPVKPAVLEMLTKKRVSYIESYFAADVTKWLLEHHDWGAIEQLLRASSEVSGGASRVLGAAARGGLDLAPILEALIECLGASSWYIRDGAAVALTAQLDRRPDHAPLLRDRLANLALDSQSGDIRNLLTALGRPVETES